MVGVLSSIEPVASELGERIASTQKWLVDEAGLSVHGLLDLGTNYNFKRPATGNNLYRVFDYSGAGSFEPNQAELYLSRSMPNQPGFVVDLNFLNTAEVMHGLTSYYGDQPGAHNPTGWMDPTQVYLTYPLPVGNGINLSAGRQVSLIGFEYIPSWNNINFNQSIDLMYSLGEPFTVTGLRGTYSFNEHVAATLGVNNGWDTIATSNPLQTIEAQLSLTPSQVLTWNLQGMYGPSTGTQSGSKRGLANTTVAWKTPYKPLQLGFEYLFADQSAPVLFSPLAESPAYPNPLLSPVAQPIRLTYGGRGSVCGPHTIPPMRYSSRPVANGLAILPALAAASNRISARSPKPSAMRLHSFAISPQGWSIGTIYRVSILSPIRDPSLPSCARRGDAYRPTIRIPGRTRWRRR